jgi:N-acetylmuramoyl-L-alanine amidase
MSDFAAVVRLGLRRKERGYMGFVIDGSNEVVAGLQCASWRDKPAIPRLSVGGDSRTRSTKWVRGIVLHTTKGIPGGHDKRPQVIRPGLGTDRGDDIKVAKFWSTEARPSGAHLVVDRDGSIVCLADLLLEAAYHAGPVNDVTIGIEIYQGSDAELYDGQLEVVVRLVDWLTRRFGIQRQIPHHYGGHPITRLAAGGRNLVGVYGHRDVTDRRGAGDPGDEIFRRLAAAGYERWDFGAMSDLLAWRERQVALAAESHQALDIDGIPGRGTRDVLASLGRPHGLWVHRPGD